MFWVSKFMPKYGTFGVLFEKNVFSIRKQCLAAIEAISSLPGTVFHERIGSYRHVQKIPTPLLFGKSYESKYCVSRVVIWRDVWRNIGLSNAKNSNKKGTES